jgi:hypothetical protein
MRLPSLSVALALTISAALPAAAFAGPSRDGVVGEICAHVVGLMPGERHYAACVDSLSTSLAGLGVAEGNSRARQGCVAQGLEPGTPALAECVLAAGKTQAPPELTATGATPVPGGSRSYFEVSRETAVARDKLACARLGFDPTQEAFGGCVADLRSALARASEPSM